MNSQRGVVPLCGSSVSVEGGSTSVRHKGRRAQFSPKRKPLSAPFLNNGVPIASVHFMYLRQKQLTSFDPYVVLKHVTMLDLSMNYLSTMNFLSLFPNLRHLFMTGNKLEHLSNLDAVPDLETLAVSSNRIKTFEGLGDLKQLKLLSLNYNEISSLQGFPFLPSLQAVNIKGNPIDEWQDIRRILLALSPVSLVQINGREVTPTEKTEATAYHGSIAYALSEGFIPPSPLTPTPPAHAPIHAFLSHLQKQRALSAGHPPFLIPHTLEVRPPSDPLLFHEGTPLTLQVCLQDTRPARETPPFESHVLSPVVFQVTGNAQRVELTGSFVTGGRNTSSPGDTNQPTRLELYRESHCPHGVETGGGEPQPGKAEEENEEGVAFSTRLYLPPGSYAYQYVVDGETRVSEAAPTGVGAGAQGVCNLCEVSVSAPARETQSLLHVRWLRSTEGGVGGFEVIPNAKELTYVPTAGDVGHFLRAEVLVYDEGEFQFPLFAITPNIEPGLPLCAHMELSGRCVEGASLVLDVEYAGGEEGQSETRWFRVVDHDEEVPLDTNSPAYVLSPSDVAHRIKAEYLPVRQDGERGTPASRYSDVILPRPCVTGLGPITGEGVEGATLTVECDDPTALQQKCHLQWGHYDPRSGEFHPRPGAHDLSYPLTLPDVGATLALQCTLKSASPTRLSPTPELRLRSDPIRAAPPTIEDFRLTGSPTEGSALQLHYSYRGGNPGAHQLVWFRESTGGDAGGGVRQVVEETTHGKGRGSRGSTRRGSRGSTATGTNTTSTTGMSATGTATPGMSTTGTSPTGTATPGTSATGTSTMGTCGLAAPLCLRRVLTTGDVGYRMGAMLTPVRSDGVHGATVEVVGGCAVGARGPQVGGPMRVRWERGGEGVTIGVVEYTYVGGKEGESHVEWYKVEEGEGEEGEGRLIQDGGRECVVDGSEVGEGELIRVVVTPVRSDGLRGPSRVVESRVSWDAGDGGEELGMKTEIDPSISIIQGGDEANTEELNPNVDEVEYPRELETDGNRSLSDRGQDPATTVEVQPNTPVLHGDEEEDVEETTCVDLSERPHELESDGDRSLESSSTKEEVTATAMQVAVEGNGLDDLPDVSEVSSLQDEVEPYIQ